MSGFVSEIWSQVLIDAMGEALADKVDREIMDMHHSPEKFLPEDIRALITLSGVGVTYIGGEGAEWNIMFGNDRRFIETSIPAESDAEMWRLAIGSTIDKWNETQNEQAQSRL